MPWRSSIPAMPCGRGCWRFDRQLPSRSDDCCSARPIRQARGRRGRACRLPANLPATRSRRRSHEGDAPPGSRARLASEPDPDDHRTSTRTAVHPSSSSSLPSGVILPGPATQARNERSAAALSPTDQVSNEWVGRSVERHRAQIREHPGVRSLDDARDLYDHGRIRPYLGCLRERPQGLSWVCSQLGDGDSASDHHRRV